jgi:hypothetical protein
VAARTEVVSPGLGRVDPFRPPAETSLTEMGIGEGTALADAIVAVRKSNPSVVAADAVPGLDGSASSLPY